MNLAHEIHQIRNLKIHARQKRALISLVFESERIYEDFLDFGWLDGKTKRGQDSIAKNKKEMAMEYIDLISQQYES